MAIVRFCAWFSFLRLQRQWRIAPSGERYRRGIVGKRIGAFGFIERIRHEPCFRIGGLERRPVGLDPAPR